MDVTNAENYEDQDGGYGFKVWNKAEEWVLRFMQPQI